MKWAHAKLAKVTDAVDYGLTASAQAARVGPRFLRITDIQDDSVDWDSVPYCACESSQIEKYALRRGDILFARTGATTGKSFLVRACPEVTVFASYLIRVRPSARLDPVYLSYFFGTPEYWQQISASANGSTQPGVNSSKLRELSVPIPPLKEQKRIAAILDKADAIRRSRQEAARLADELIPSMFYKTFADWLRMPLAGMPRLGDAGLADIASGVTKGRRLNGQRTVVVPYIRVANVQDGYLDVSEIKTIEVLPSDVETLRLKRGDVLMTEGGDFDKLGRGTIWEHDIPDCIHQNHIFRVRCNRNLLLPLYFAHYIRSHLGKGYFLRCAKKTSNLATINKTQLRELPVPLPSLTVQEAFVAEVEGVQKMKRRQADVCRAGDDLFNSLVQRAFRGEL